MGSEEEEHHEVLNIMLSAQPDLEAVSRIAPCMCTQHVHPACNRLLKKQVPGTMKDDDAS
jgi:hypothetical protein